MDLYLWKGALPNKTLFWGFLINQGILSNEFMVRLVDIQTLTGAALHCGEIENKTIEYGFGSDLMSDVLTLEDKTPLLITGLSNIQVIRTAEMADLSAILIVRNKQVTKEMVELAKENDIVLMSTSLSLFKVCGILYKHGLKSIF